MKNATVKITAKPLSASAQTLGARVCPGELSATTPEITAGTTSSTPPKIDPMTLAMLSPRAHHPAALEVLVDRAGWSSLMSLLLRRRAAVVSAVYVAVEQP